MSVKATLAAILLSAAASSVLTYELTDPRAKADQVQSALLAEYVRVYCTPESRWSPEFASGRASLASTMTVRAGIGAIAMAEYAKCKAGL